MGNKIKLIDKIVEKHPSYGVEKGWSEYTGGMTDSGRWFYRKMLNVSEKELRSFLNEIIKEESATILTTAEKGELQNPAALMNDVDWNLYFNIKK